MICAASLDIEAVDTKRGTATHKHKNTFLWNPVFQQSRDAMLRLSVVAKRISTVPSGAASSSCAVVPIIKDDEVDWGDEC